MTYITRSQYLENSSELHHSYNMQFVTDTTLKFVVDNIGLDKLRKSKDYHFNDIIKHSNGGSGGWIWDFTPIDLELARELGAVGKNSLPSPATRTCIGKAAARHLLQKEG